MSRLRAQFRSLIGLAPLALLLCATDANVVHVRRATAHRPGQARLNRVSHRLRASDPHHEESELIAVQLRDNVQSARVDHQPTPLPAVEAEASRFVPVLAAAGEPAPFFTRERECPLRSSARDRAPPSLL